MKPIDQYPITFPYGATSSPYSPTHPHRGDDRGAPTGTPVLAGGVQIGLVGSTGLSTGPHLHVQEWQGSIANVRKPQNAFKGGKVVAATSSTDFGNYVTIQTSDGWNDTYAHLSKITVSVGQEVGVATDNLTKEELVLLYSQQFDLPESQVNQDVVRAFTGKRLGEYLQYIQADPSYQAHFKAVNNPPPGGNVPAGTYLKIDKANIVEAK